MALMEKQLVSIDWDSRTLRVVHFAVRPKGGVRVHKVLSVAIPPEVTVGDPASFGKLLRDVLSREGIRAGRMVVDVPRDQVVLNTLTLPAVSVDDLPAMVEYQIAKELPFPLSDAVTDFAVPDAPPEGGTQEVLVAAVRNEVLDYYRQTAAEAGLKLDRVGLRPYANKVSLTEVLGGTRHERVLFVDVGPALTEIDVLRDGRLTFSRAASVHVPPPAEAPPPEPESKPAADDGPLDLSISLSSDAEGPAVPDAGRVVRALVREVVLTIEAYRAGDPGASMDYVVVAGDTGLEELVLEAIRDRIGLAGELYNPTESLGWDGGSGAAAGGFSAALGLALGHASEGRLHFDFVNPKKAIPAGKRRLKKVPAVGLVALVFIAAGVVLYVGMIVPREREIAGLEARIKDDKATLNETKKFNKMMAQIERFESEQVIWLDELVDVFSVWPDHDEIVLSQINMSQDPARIQLKMDCKSTDVASAAREALDEFELPEDGLAKFDAELGTSTDQKKGDYPTRVSMDIKLIERGVKD